MSIESIRASAKRIVDSVIMVIVAGAIATLVVMVINDAHAQAGDVPYSEDMDALEDARRYGVKRFQPPGDPVKLYFMIQARCIQSGMNITFGSIHVELARAAYAYVNGRLSGAELIAYVDRHPDVSDKFKNDTRILVEEMCPPIGLTG